MIIFDASTLILLAKIELLELFISDLKDEVLIPETVQTEVLKEEKEETLLIKSLIGSKKVRAVRIEDKGQIKKLIKDFGIGKGEAEAIMLAIEQGVKIVATDDRNAIRACKLLHLEFITAITVLIRAVEKRLIDNDEALVKLQKLQHIGRYSKAIIQDATNQIKGDV